MSKSQSGEEIKFPEQSIDQLRLQKESVPLIFNFEQLLIVIFREELDAFRKASERKIKDKAFTNQFSQWSTKKEKRKGASYSRTQ